MIRVLMCYGIYILSITQPLLAQNVTQNNDENNVLEFDFPSMKVGVAENEEGPTGTTVFYFPSGIMEAAQSLSEMLIQKRNR